MNTDTLMVVMLLLFTQNRQFMEDMRPALDFLEEHKDAVAILGQMFGKGAPGAEGGKTPPPETDGGGKAAEKQEDPPQKAAGQTERSPLEGIASEAILNGIRSYLSAQPK